MTCDEDLRQELTEDARLRFEALYERQGSWDVDRPQPALVLLAQQGAIRGTVLDVGCGTGDNALHLAALGYPTWGIDIVPGAISEARRKARDRGLPFGRFMEGNGLALEELDLQVDTVVDSGFFHALCDRERPFFLRGLRSVLRIGGSYHLLGFSDRQPGNTGPRRLTEHDLRTTFSQGWTVIALQETLFDTRIHPGGARAWLLSAQRNA